MSPSVCWLTASLTLCSWKLASMQHWPGVFQEAALLRGEWSCCMCVWPTNHGWLHHQDVRHQRPGQQTSVRGDLGSGRSLEEVCFVVGLNWYRAFNTGHNVFCLYSVYISLFQSRNVTNSNVIYSSFQKDTNCFRVKTNNNCKLPIFFCILFCKKSFNIGTYRTTYTVILIYLW